MSFKVIITKDYIKMNGTKSEMLAGLGCYIATLKSQGIPRFMIDEAIRYGAMSDEELDKAEKELNKKIDNFMKKIFD